MGQQTSRMSDDMIAFLRARLNEDEAAAKAAADSDYRQEWKP